MRKVLAIVGLFFATLTASAQATLGEGNAQLNAGVGLSSGWGVPVYVGLDYGITEDITVGGEVSYQSYSVPSWKHTVFGVVAKGDYHFNRILNLPSAFDLYAGISLGYYAFSTKSSTGNYSYSGSALGGLNPGLQIGGRYFFTDSFGLNLEFGGGTVASGGKFGITYKF